ncbi:MAG TPA: VOC family protein [Usitatibacteraceae bacterium]|nr:VOC family protein [Usitatibacteraceae bacterium]
MKRVTGIGGIFFKAKDPATLRAWYKRHLGIDVQDWGGTGFRWADEGERAKDGQTVWTIFDPDSKYFEPTTAPFMVNYRVDNLHALIAALRAEGCKVDDKVEESEYGKFGWVTDPEGQRIELWEPPPGG